MVSGVEIAGSSTASPVLRSITPPTEKSIVSAPVPALQPPAVPSVFAAMIALGSVQLPPPDTFAVESTVIVAPNADPAESLIILHPDAGMDTTALTIRVPRGLAALTPAILAEARASRPER